MLCSNTTPSFSAQSKPATPIMKRFVTCRCTGVFSQDQLSLSAAESFSSGEPFRDWKNLTCMQKVTNFPIAPWPTKMKSPRAVLAAIFKFRRRPRQADRILGSVSNGGRVK